MDKDDIPDDGWDWVPPFPELSSDELEMAVMFDWFYGEDKPTAH